jgi:large subunit ribosomal protein L5
MANKNQVAKAAATDQTAAKYVSRVKQRYNEEVIPYLIKRFNYTNVNQVPKLVKITLNTGLGDVKDNAKSVQLVQEEMKQIAGQKPVLTKAKKSVANFKVREGMTVGIKVTLRNDKMYDFFDKFVSVALPRVRDFKGVSAKSFDGRGNYAMGVKEQLIFPEISYDQVEKIRGFDICFVTTAKTDEEARELLKALGMPFKAN